MQLCLVGYESWLWRAMEPSQHIVDQVVPIATIVLHSDSNVHSLTSIMDLAKGRDDSSLRTIWHTPHD